MELDIIVITPSGQLHEVLASLRSMLVVKLPPKIEKNKNQTVFQVHHNNKRKVSMK